MLDHPAEVVDVVAHAQRVQQHPVGGSAVTAEAGCGCGDAAGGEVLGEPVLPAPGCVPCTMDQDEGGTGVGGLDVDDLQLGCAPARPARQASAWAKVSSSRGMSVPEGMIPISVTPC